MKKKTVITTETREVWVVRQASRFEEAAPADMEAEPTNESLGRPIDHDAKKDSDSSESTTPDVQE